MEKINDVIFYQIEQTIKTYRMFAQKQIKKNGIKITIDQWLVLKSLKENPNISQAEIAEKVFKDNASITRIFELLVNLGYVARETNPNDRRKFNLTILPLGNQILENTYKVVLENRKKGLEGISKKKIEMLSETLSKITNNCKY